MKSAPSKTLQAFAIITVVMVAFSNISTAEKIYTWKDENGRTHYTNNEALVPLKNDADVIKMKTAAAPTPEEPSLNGQAIWIEKCKSCHNLDAEFKEGKRRMRGLVQNITDPYANPDKNFTILQSAIDDNMNEAIEMTLSPEEMEAVMAYIVAQVKLNQAPTPLVSTPSDNANEPIPE